MRRRAKRSSIGSRPAYSRARKSLFGLTCACVLAVAAFSGTGASALAADACSNEAIRAQSLVNPLTSQPYSAALPECRAYEMVSPQEKQAHDFGMFYNKRVQGSATTDGNTIGTVFAGSFPDPDDATNIDVANGTTDISRRTAGGWKTSAALVPAGIVPGYSQGPGSAVFSADGDRVAACGGVDDNLVTNGTTLGVGLRCAIREADGTWIPGALYKSINGNAVSPGLILGASDDLEHLFFMTGLNAARLLPADPAVGNDSASIYELAGQGTGNPTLRLVNVDDQGHGIYGARLGGGIYPPGGVVAESYNAISRDGGTVFFTATLPGKAQTVYARVDGERTVTVSNPTPAECTTCSAAEAEGSFQGASADGSLVFFTTTQQLLDTDTDFTADVYMYDFDAPASGHLTQLSVGGAGDVTPGQGAEVAGVASTSREGSKVYFVAGGVLTTLPNSYGQSAAPGASNLYGVDTATGDTRFLGILGGGDATLWGPTRGPAQQTPDGRYLVFSTVQPLAPDDSDGGAADIYRYDADTHDLIRISIGQPGFPDSNNGNTPGRNATIGARADYYPDANADNIGRAISDDGKSIVFSTPEQLQGDDVNNPGTGTGCPTGIFLAVNTVGCDIYLWRDGAVQMISDGRSPRGAGSPIRTGPLGFNASQGAISKSGRDIFFSTHTPLVPQDGDEQMDVYDARVGGGFPYAATTTCGDTDGCRTGGPQSPPADPAPATPTVNGPGNQVPQRPKKAQKKKHKKKTKKKGAKKKQKAGKQRSKRASADTTSRSRG